MKNLFFTTLLLLASVVLPAQSEDLRVVPNPVIDRFEIGHSERVTRIHVVNMIGREVKTFAYEQGTGCDISDLPQGMYLVQLRDEEDRVLHTQRVRKG